MPAVPVTGSGIGDPAVAVVAAGALCWRINQGKLEVLLIHRPRYQDWSWPKGKLDDGETTPEAAVREVREEVGLDIRLGIPLPSIRYQVSAGLKVVHYWAAKVDRATPVADGEEVDKLLWCSPERAFELLTNPSDEEPLEALLTAYHRGDLDTWPLLVVRHAKAKPRSSWTRAEGERTLAATGRRQALAIQRLLMAWQPDRVISSPWTRCIQTITPYVKIRKLKIKRCEAITEASHHRKPKKAAAVLEGLFDKRKPVVVCTHRPVLPTVIKEMSKHMQDSMSDRFPKSDPYLSPGEAWIMHVSCMHHGRIVSLEQYKPLDR
jgi:8-oxo-(d)GTP phosphatase